jgi:short-subunit dehydrogenase
MKTIFITGAGSGFGKFYSLSLAKRGFDVIAACENQSQITSLKKAAKDHDLKLNIIKVNIADPSDREYAAKFDIDILVNNAGVGEGGALVDIPEDRLRHQIEINYFSTLFLTQLFLRKFAHKKEGRVIFIS